MNLSDYEALWKRPELPRGMDADVADLKCTFEAKHRKLERTIVLRNFIEGVGGIFAAVGFGILAWRMGIRSWSINLGLGLIAAVACVFLHDWWRFRRTRSRPEAPLLARIDSSITELRHQRALVGQIGKWYLSSYLAAMILIGAGLLQHLASKAPPGLGRAVLSTPATLAWIVIILGTVIVAIVWWWVDVQRAIRLQIDPRLAELDKLRRDLVGPGG